MKQLQTWQGTATKLLALLIILPLALAAANSAAAGGPDDPPVHPEKHGREFRSLDEAVAAGKLDAELVDTLSSEGSIEAIVTFESADILDEAELAAPEGPERAKAIIDAASGKFAERKGRALGHHKHSELVKDYENLPLSLVRFRSEGALLAFLNSDEVSGVRANGRGTTALDQSLPLVRVTRADGARLISQTGAGTYVAVIDTGVDYRRTAFGSCSAPGVPSTCKVFRSFHFQNTSDCELVSANGGPGSELHGTNVAGIITGVAPGTRILDFDVFSYDAASDSCYYDDDYVVSAIKETIAWKKAGYDIRAINMSLGYSGTRLGACPGSIYTSVFDLARRVGILPVVASGNDGFSDGVAYPACTPGAVSVGAVYDDPCEIGAPGSCETFGLAFYWQYYAQAPNCSESVYPLERDRVTCFSNSGPSLSLLAPGWRITAAGVTMGGTSQAAPHVAGAAAVLASARPTATADAIQWALVNNGKVVRDYRNGQENRRLDVYSALDSLLNRPVDTTAPVASEPVHAIPFDFQAVTSATSTIPVTISWSASDRGGIAQYSVYRSVNSGAWTMVTLADPKQTSVSSPHTAGVTYSYAVRAKDLTGNWSVWKYDTFTVRTYQENSSAISYSAGWTSVAKSDAYGGFEKTSSYQNFINVGGYAGCATPYSSQPVAQLKFTGENVMLIAPLTTDGGQATVFLDGQCIGDYYLRATTRTARQTILSLNVDNPTATHTLAVYAGGTGRTSIDAFIVVQ